MSDITVVMPVKNGASFIAQAIESIALQGVPELLLIVIDDGSDDGSALCATEAARKHGLTMHLLKTPGVGPAAARNRGIQLTTSEYLSFLDCDDLWPAERLQQHLNYLESDSHCQLVVGKLQIVSKIPKRLAAFRFKDASQSLFGVNLAAATYRRSLFDTIGLLNEALIYGEDHDFFLRLREAKIPMKYVENTSLVYRLHDGNMTKDLSAKQMSLFSILRSSLHRRQHKAIAKIGQ